MKLPFMRGETPRTPPRAKWSIGVALGAVLVFGVPAVSDFWTFVATLCIVYALLGLSLVVLTGWSGQLNLHVAALGLGWGAYASFALISAGAAPIVGLVGAAFLTIPFSLIIGVIAVRFRGLELAVATLALGLTFQELVFRNLGSWLASGETDTPFESSFVTVPRPSLGGLSFRSDTNFYLLALVLGALVYVALHYLARGSFRRSLFAIREREVAASVAGIPALSYRIGAFVISIAIAGLAGALFASLKMGIAPDTFDLDLSFLMLAAVVIGGVRTLPGGVLAGVLVATLPEVVRFGPFKVLGGERLLLGFAAGLVLTLWLRPQGLLGAVTRHVPRERIPTLRSDAVAPKRRRSSTERRREPTALRVDDVAVHFGGVQALDGVSLSVPRGEICALIGPNGAGKTTLFNCISGILDPDRGRSYVNGEDVTDMPPHRRTALGLGRTFQSVELFSGLTILENMLATGARSEAQARDALDVFALGELADTYPNELPAGHLRSLEIARVLVREPRVLLLDEPTAGLDPDESSALARKVAALRDESPLNERALTVLFVEHDMAVVGEIAEWVYVLDFGRVIAQGPPQRVRKDPLVIGRYLGDVERTHA